MNTTKPVRTCALYQLGLWTAVWILAAVPVRGALNIDTEGPFPEGTVGPYNQIVLRASGGTPPYSWSVISGSLPAGLTVLDAFWTNPDDTTNGILSGTVDSSALEVTPQPFASSTNTFTVQVMDSAFATATKEFTIVIREGWNHPEIVPGDFNSIGLGGVFNWSDPNNWEGGNVPGDNPGSVVNLENTLGADSTNVVDGTFTLGVLRARNFNVVSKTIGEGKLIFDNGTNPAVVNFNSRLTRYSAYFTDFYVDMQLNSDLDFRWGANRQEQETVGRIGRQISGPGHLTLTLSCVDATATRFFKLGAGAINTYSGGTTLRHASAIAYGYRHNSENRVLLAASEGAFGAGDVTLDGTQATATINGAPALNRGMWVRFSASDVMAPGSKLYLVSRSRIILELAADTTNTVHVIPDGLPLPAGTYTGGDFSWLFGEGTLVVLNTNPAPVVEISNSNPLPAAREDEEYSLALTPSGGSAPYTWELVEGELPGSLSLSAEGVISGTAGEPTTASFTIRVTESGGAFSEKQFDLVINPAVPPKEWNIPPITFADFVATGAGSFTWSDPTAWEGGNVPVNAAGKQVTLEPRLVVGDTETTIDGTYTIGGLSSRDASGNILAIRGEGKLIFNNGAKPAIWNLHRTVTRFSSLRPDAYVDIQLNSDLEIRMGAMRPNEATVGRIGKQISGPGHLTLTLSSHDASATRFHRLGEGATNTYSGGTTVRHISQSPYGSGHNTILAVHLNAVTNGAFGTGDVTFDAANCTHNASFQAALGNFGRGMWIRFSDSNVMAPGSTMNILSVTNFGLELFFDTTNTVHVNIDGEPLAPGTYTGGQLDWLYGFGYLVVPERPATIDANYDGSSLTLTWQGDATLQAAPDVSGVYTNVPGAVSPHVITDLNEQKQFFRLLLP